MQFLCIIFDFIQLHFEFFQIKRQFSTNCVLWNCDESRIEGAVTWSQSQCAHFCYKRIFFKSLIFLSQVDWPSLNKWLSALNWTCQGFRFAFRSLDEQFLHPHLVYQGVYDGHEQFTNSSRVHWKHEIALAKDYFRAHLSTFTHSNWAPAIVLTI